MRTGGIELLDWISAPELAALAQVHRTTAARWKRRELTTPYAVLRLIELELGGHVGIAAGDAWRGWFFADGLLCSPFSPRFQIRPGELNAYMLLRFNGEPAARIAQTLMIPEPETPGRLLRL